MPYISQPSRAGLDAHIDALANEIRALAKSEGHDAAFCGPLNYACTKLALQVIPVRRYWTIALVVGVFKNIADEFYRRYAVPYEDEKIAEHGDVYEAWGTPAFWRMRASYQRGRDQRATSFREWRRGEESLRQAG